MKYGLHIASVGTENVHTVTDVRTASFKVIELSAKEARAELAAIGGSGAVDFRVTLTELDSEGDPTFGTLLELTSDGETVSEVLAARLKRLRKQPSAAATE